MAGASFTIEFVDDGGLAVVVHDVVNQGVLVVLHIHYLHIVMIPPA